MCLGPNGMTACNEQALWILTRRPNKKTYSLVSLLNPSPYGMCLEHKRTFFGLFGTSNVGIGLCSKSGSKSWNFEFTGGTKHVKLSSNGQCVVRGKKKYKNSISTQNCKKGEYLPFLYNPTSVHDAGFFLKSADGRCLDGNSFASCTQTLNVRSLLWGVGVKYIWGKANRYFYNFVTKECLVAKGSRLERDDCDHAGT